jgi:hypothetical protein
MKKIVRLTESDLTRIVKRVIKESNGEMTYDDVVDFHDKFIEDRTGYNPSEGIGGGTGLKENMKAVIEAQEELRELMSEAMMNVTARNIERGYKEDNF